MLRCCVPLAVMAVTLTLSGCLHSRPSLPADGADATPFPILLRPDGTPMLVSGSPGGTYIIACMAQTIINLVDFNLPITEAVYSPRVAGTDGGKTRIEGRLDQEVIDELTEMGHDIEITKDYDPNMGSSNSIVVLDDGTYHGCGDPRRDSQCAAY